MLFSHRKGLKPVRKAIQKDYMDDELRNRLWNALKIHYWNKIKHYSSWRSSHSYIYNLCVSLWHSLFKIPLDTLDAYNWLHTYKTIREYFFKCEWNEVYDFIEFVSKTYGKESYHYDEINSNFRNMCNNIFDEENSAYRFVNEEIIEITSEEEISEIEEALGQPFKPVKIHLKRALELLSDRKKPDYRNSIKESISAVEAICKIITKNKKAKLGNCLDKIKNEKRVKLHPALAEAFKKLYGYTSDAEGIRHPLLDEPTLSYEDAKFMLVSCSAFVNYVISKFQE